MAYSSTPPVVLLGVTGGIAAYKAAWLASRLTAAGCAVDVVMTDAAQQFVTPLTFSSLTGRPAHTSLWAAARDVRTVHIALADRADLALVAPATANTLAKMASGWADNLLTSVLLAYRGPVLVAPAMNEGMWNHPATRANMAALRERGVSVAGPASGRLACGTSGDGRMAEPDDILRAALSLLDARGLPSASSTPDAT